MRFIDCLKSQLALNEEILEGSYDECNDLDLCDDLELENDLLEELIEKLESDKK